MRQAENRVYIEGILAEVNLKEGSYNKNGKDSPYISGTISVKVSQLINEKMEDLIIPVHMFASKFKNDGGANPAYKSLLDIMENFVSIAAAGDEAGADRIRISRGELAQNDYIDLNGTERSYPRVRASFINKIKAAECKPKATFNIEFCVGKIYDEVDLDGIETGRLKVKGIVPQYGGRVDVMEFTVASKAAVDAIRQYWIPNKTFKATGKLNFSQKTEIVLESAGFGEPIEKSKTINISEIIITGGSESPLEGEFEFDPTEIKAALVERNARLEAEKNKPRKAAIKTAPTVDSNDFGF